MELKKIGIMILCLIVIFAISAFKILEQKRVEKILNEEMDMRLENVDYENFQVYNSCMCNNCLTHNVHILLNLFMNLILINNIFYFIIFLLEYSQLLHNS